MTGILVNMIVDGSAEGCQGGTARRPFVHLLDTRKESEELLVMVMEDKGMVDMIARFMPCCRYRG